MVSERTDVDRTVLSTKEMIKRRPREELFHNNKYGNLTTSSTYDSCQQEPY